MFYDDDGNSSYYPFSLAVAKRKHYKKYTWEKPCPQCGCVDRFVKNDKCVLCAEYDAADLFYYASGIMKFKGLTTCYSSDSKAFNKPPDREITQEHKNSIIKYAGMVCASGIVARWAEDAIRVGLKHYAAPMACETSGHIGVMNLNQDCYFCELEKDSPSPRQIAKVSGETWYTPEKPCPYCGKLAPRRVSNGECKACVESRPNTDNRRNATSIMMENAPDMIISREDARKLQLKVFRTGEPCRRGHRGFRWTSTGNCIPCAKGER